MSETVAAPAVLVNGMRGLGDNVYQRAFVRILAEQNDVYLRTPWPELYEDLPVRFVRDATHLRTQAKNLARQDQARWSPAATASRSRIIEVHYGRDLEKSSIIRIMASRFGLNPETLTFDLPDFGPAPITADKPIALFRPVTIRKEWLNNARAPDPEYIARAARILRERFHVVSVADLSAKEEWLVGELPEADACFHAGEFNVRQLLALASHAAVIVGGVGLIAPVAVAAKRPLVLIAGGNGAFNAPERIFDPRLDTARVRWLMPDRYCRCRDMKHTCDKRIRDFETRFRAALAEVETTP